MTNYPPGQRQQQQLCPFVDLSASTQVKRTYKEKTSTSNTLILLMNWIFVLHNVHYFAINMVFAL